MELLGEEVSRRRNSKRERSMRLQLGETAGGAAWREMGLSVRTRKQTGEPRMESPRPLEALGVLEQRHVRTSRRLHHSGRKLRRVQKREGQLQGGP